MKRKGVIYDVGRVMFFSWRPDYDPRLVRGELEIIARDLHCTAVKILGRDTGRLLHAGEIAAGLGMEVWFCPELYGRSPARTLAYMQAAAAAAERLRRHWPERVVFSLGTELSLFMRAMVPGRTYGARVRSITAMRPQQREDTALRAFLDRCVIEVRREFHGPITYAALPFEPVNWDRFDIVGINHYWRRPAADRYLEALQRWTALDKPLAISELGFRTRTGADETGPAGPVNIEPFSMLAHKVPLLGRHIRPRVKTIYERNEALQAECLTRQLELLDQAGVDGAFIHTFTFPLQPYSDSPRHDLDADNFSLVKTLPHGRRGLTYPGMPWEPKQSFFDVAEFYASH